MVCSKCKDPVSKKERNDTTCIAVKAICHHTGYYSHGTDLKGDVHFDCCSTLMLWLHAKLRGKMIKANSMQLKFNKKVSKECKKLICGETFLFLVSPVIAVFSWIFWILNFVPQFFFQWKQKMNQHPKSPLPRWSSPFLRCVLLPHGQLSFLIFFDFFLLHSWLHSGSLGDCFLLWLC